MTDDEPDDEDQSVKEAHAKASETFKPRDTQTALAQSLAHGRRVGLMRKILPVVVILILAFLIAWPRLNNGGLVATVAEHIPNLVVENLNLTGLDGKNQPYVLKAAKALQSAGDKNVIELEKPQGDITLSDGSWIAGRANTGKYDQTGKSLWLNGDVEIFHDGGYQFRTSEARVDLRDNLASGDKPVEIQGDFGQIQGSGFSVTDKGNTVIIKGPARAELQLQDNKSSGKTEAGKPNTTPQRGKR